MQLFITTALNTNAAKYATTTSSIKQVLDNINITTNNSANQCNWVYLFI